MNHVDSLFQSLLRKSLTSDISSSTRLRMGATYLFTVNGNNVHQIVEWDCGDIDPGKEELRVATGGLYPGCTVSDYNQQLDKALPREVHGYENGVITNVVGVVGNVPVAGPVVVAVAKAVAPIVKQIPIIGGLFH